MTLLFILVSQKPWIPMALPCHVCDGRINLEISDRFCVWMAWCILRMLWELRKQLLKDIYYIFCIYYFIDLERPRRLLVFVNPYGGKKQAPKIFRNKVRPLFELARIDIEVIGKQICIDYSNYFSKLCTNACIKFTSRRISSVMFAGRKLVSQPVPLLQTLWFTLHINVVHKFNY